MNKLFFASVLALTFFCASPVSGIGAKTELHVYKTEHDAIRITIGSTPILFSEEPFIDTAGRTQVPVRDLAEQLGMEVSWFEDEKQISISTAVTEGNGGAGGDSYHFVIGENRYRKNSTYYEADTSAVIINDTAFVPLRFFCEMLGYGISFTDNSTPGTAAVEFYDCLGNLILDTDDIISCQVVPESERPDNVNGACLELTFSDDGSAAFAAATARISQYAAPDNYISICIYGEPISVPRVSEAINSGKVIISGSFTDDDAQELADMIIAAIGSD